MYFFGFSNSAWAEGVLTPSNGLGHRLCSFCLAINRLYLSDAPGADGLGGASLRMHT